MNSERGLLHATFRIRVLAVRRLQLPGCRNSLDDGANCFLSLSDLTFCITQFAVTRGLKGTKLSRYDRIMSKPRERYTG